MFGTSKTNIFMSNFIFLKIILIVFLVYYFYCNHCIVKSGNVKLGFFKDFNFFSLYNRWVMKNSKYTCKPIESSTEVYLGKENVLKKNWKIIRDEIATLITNGHTKNITNDMFFKNFTESDWTCFYLKTYGNDYFPEAENLAPKTTALLKTIPEIKLAMFSILGPRTKIKPHRGPYKGALRYHLGLECPRSDLCFIKVDGNKYIWRNGEDVMFDDTYVHEVVNDTDERRIILFCDFLRPMKNKRLDLVNERASNYLAPIFLKKNKNNEQQSKI